MFGCSSLPAAFASFWKRAITCTARSGSTRSLRTVLIATTRSMCGSNALYTTPIAPLPSTLWIMYLPIFSGSAMRLATWRLPLKHLYCLDQALVHPRQRLGEHTDLILAPGLELCCFEIAEAHLVGELGELLDALDHDRVQHDVEQDERDYENERQQQHENLERVVRALDRQRAGHRDDLRADDLVQLPAEAVGGTVELDHRLRRLGDGIMARKAGRVLDLDRPCQVQRLPAGRVALADQLGPLDRSVAKLVDDVGFPVGCPIARIGWIERRFLVAVIRILLAQVVELLRRGISRYRLRQERIPELGLEQRRDLRVRIAARRKRRLHHHARVVQNLLAGVGLEHAVRDEAGQDEAHGEEREQYDVELPHQLHSVPLRIVRLAILFISSCRTASSISTRSSPRPSVAPRSCHCPSPRPSPFPCPSLFPCPSPDLRLGRAQPATLDTPGAWP